MSGRNWLIVTGLIAVGAGIGAAWVTRPAPPLAGDGATDDTDAIQKPIDAGGAVRFPKGVYRITRTLTVDLDKVGYTALTGDGTATLRMDGPGPAVRFVGTHEGTAAPNSFKPNVWDRQRTPRVDGLEIVGHHPDADGIEASGTMQL